MTQSLRLAMFWNIKSLADEESFPHTTTVMKESPSIRDSRYTDPE